RCPGRSADKRDTPPCSPVSCLLGVLLFCLFSSLPLFSLVRLSLLSFLLSHLSIFISINLSISLSSLLPPLLPLSLPPLTSLSHLSPRTGPAPLSTFATALS